MLFIESAVPMVLQCPTLGALSATHSRKVCMSMRPAASSCRAYQTMVPEPARPPAKWPSSIGPPDSTIDGMLTVQAPMIIAGVVLSQPVVSTTPSKK